MKIWYTNSYWKKSVLGFYVPLTMDGNILVDGVLASCYASLDHDLFHALMTPLQWFPEVTKWTFGEYNGLHAYVKILADVARWLAPHGFVYEDAHLSV